MSCSKKMGRCLNKDKCPLGYYKCPNGCMNLKVIKYGGKKDIVQDLLSFDKDFHVKTLRYPKPPTVMNKGIKCFARCREKGPCPAFCGEGLCCKQGDPGKLCDGETGGEKSHVCVPRPVIPKLEMASNEGAKCLDKCGGKKGREHQPEFGGERGFEEKYMNKLRKFSFFGGEGNGF